MTDIVNSLRKHQKMIILGAALGVIALYILPLDQLVSAVNPPGLSNAIAKIGEIRAKILANIHLKPEVKARIDQHLADVQAHLAEVQYRIQGL